MATVIGRVANSLANGFWTRGQDRPLPLSDILRNGIVPRMLIAQSSAETRHVTVAAIVNAGDVEQIAPIAINESAHVLIERVESIMDRGVSAENVCVDLLAPVARWLGQEWEEDRVDFMEVSMGLWRLQEVLRHISAGAGHPLSLGQVRSAVFAAMPGDQHGFGVSMVHEFFVSAGWDAALLVDPTEQELIAVAAESDLDLIGLTLSCDCHTERLASLIRAVRSVSMNPNLRIMIGGPLIIRKPELVALSGADGTAASASDAVQAAELMVGAQRFAATA